tara:strand:- start:714 stop:860 length:147 start_codon:yes stop_codon:yes gene_type:complete
MNLGGFGLPHALVGTVGYGLSGERLCGRGIQRDQHGRFVIDRHTTTET